MAKRLDRQPGEWLDRTKRIEFRFEGEHVAAFEGDVITSALTACGHRTLARSFKYHRPRGVLSLANHDANVLLADATRTHIRADVEAPSAGAHYRAVNTWGGLKHDFLQSLALLSRLLPVGFYYKAFYRPRFAFPWWERLLRAAAGLGRIDKAAPLWRTPRRHRHCDVLIVGAGSAGLAAAHYLRESSLDVVIADENARAGGSLDYLHANDPIAAACKADALAAISQSERLTLLAGHFAAGFYADNSVPLVGPGGIVNVHARAVIMATGAYEQPAVFRNNDAPGVMLASAAARLVHRYAVTPAESACVLAGNSAAYDVALDLLNAGVNVTTIIDLEDPSARGDCAARAIAAGVQVIPNARIDAAITRGGQLAAVDLVCGPQRTAQRLACDGLLMSVGWAPAAGLLYQAGAQFEYDKALEQIVARQVPDGVFVAGRLNGVYDLTGRIADGKAAAAEVSRYLGQPLPTAARPPRSAVAQSHPYPISEHAKGQNFVDFDEDLVVGDLRTAWREGFDSVELIKRYSTIGMGPSQGKTSNMNGVRILARLNDQSVGAVGVTTPRPFTHPVALGALAGRRMRRQWCTPLHEIHRELGADLFEAGTWLRPRSYTRGSPASAVQREYQTVRAAVGLIDVSTLGKIELFGADVIALLEHAYTCSFAELKAGMTRYIFMVDGTGVLVDDGVAARFADEHFYITATSSHAQAVVRQLQLIADQLALDVAIVDRTFQLGAVNLAGPFARDVLAGICSIDLSATAFPYLGVRSAGVAGIEARLMRVGFVGELGYEIHAPAHSIATIWRALLQAGSEFGIAPFGVDAQRLLRLEKGHLIVGQDTDGTTNPFEANLGWGVRLSKPRFNGKHSLQVLQTRVARKLVGFAAVSGAEAMRENHLVIEHGAIAGRVTSIGYSPHRRATIGLAMVDRALAEIGRTLHVRLDSGALRQINVVDTPFYDPSNSRQRLETKPNE